jgi:CRP-like cAMP-binding protein
MPAIEAAALNRVSLFTELSPDELSGLAARLRERRFPKGQIIFAQGDPGNTLYLIANGRVKIVLGSNEGKELVISVLGPGDFFGELALLDGEPRSADAVTMDACDLWLLARDDFLQFLEERPRVAVRLLAVLSRHLRRTNARAQDVAFLDVPARLARSLLELANGVEPFKVTQSELAGMVGTTRESVNKWLGYFADHGLIRLQRGSVTIVKPEALRKRIY